MDKVMRKNSVEMMITNMGDDDSGMLYECTLYKDEVSRVKGVKRKMII